MSAFKVFPLSLPLAIQVALIEPRTHGDRGVEHFQLPSRVRKSLENSQHGARLFSSRGPALVLNCFSSCMIRLLWVHHCLGM